ncbi:uncharacterized protein [Halyomorpha halys]|uniref:uncharacterized protein n=1 Tax=Halyomorpha halys TaxID=286706 RepID=UPI0006D4CA35|nr:uncharacterized protein LOC106688553 [Halyomorpha halys]
MFPAAFLVLCGGLAVGLSVPMITPSLEDTATGGIRVGNSAVQLGGSLASQGTAAFTSTAKQLNAGLAALNAAALKGGVNVFKQFLDVGGRLASGIPLFGPAVGIGTSALKTGAKLFNTVGQNVINTTQSLVNTKLNVINGIVQAGTGAFMNAANVSSALASQGVQSAVKTLNNAAQNSNPVFSFVDSGIVGAKPPSTTAKPMFNFNEDLFY